ncbi:MAG: peptidase C45, partial [Planctomycetaceae bacterium]|nr:peptidase C45 [Planctomycetaceae bacterium]
MSYHHMNWRGFWMASVISILTLLQVNPSLGCTIAVVSGQVTEDGRPLLWKNRDTSSARNMVQVFIDGQYRVMAIVDAEDPDRIWMGMNDAGLCLVNSLSLDLPGGSKTGRGNGRFMKMALQNCATAADFENLLRETNQSGRRTRANFGLIDTHGAALIYETGHRTFVKFDANDAKLTPRGYVVRSNFAMTAAGAKQQGKAHDFLNVYSGRRYVR